MFCLTKEMGTPFDMVMQRPWTPEELKTAMGFPITAENQSSTGTVCAFSRGRSPPATRSRHSSVNAVGNAMHVAAIGAVTMTCLLKLCWGTSSVSNVKVDPEVGSNGNDNNTAALSTSSSSATSSVAAVAKRSKSESAFAAAFATAYASKRRRHK